MMKLNELMPLAFGWELAIAIIIGAAVFVGLAAFLMLTFYRKVEKGTALVRTGWGGTKVYFNGGIVLSHYAPDRPHGYFAEAHRD